MRQSLERFLFLDGRIPWLDGLRTLAVFMVIARHVFDRPFAKLYGAGFQPDGFAEFVTFGFASIGWAGVHVFFLISGFLVGGAVILDAHRGRFRPGEFLGKRIIRVFVPALIFSFGLRLWSGGPMDPVHAFHNLIFWTTRPADGWQGHYWSLEVELHFYLLAAAVGTWLVYTGRKITAPMLFGVAALSALLKLACAPVLYTSVSFYTFSEWQMDFFVAGAGLRLYGDRPKVNAHVLTGAAVGLLAIAAAVAASSGSFIANQKPPYPLVASLVLIMLGSTALLHSCFCGPLGRLFNAIPIRLIGAVSFSVYLVHLPIIEAMNARSNSLQMFASPLAQYAALVTIGMVLSLVGGVAFYLAVERPVMVARRLLIRPRIAAAE